MRRRLLFALALIAAVVAGVATASAITAQIAPDTAVMPVNAQPDGSGSRVPVTAADPDGRPSFAVRVYRSKEGRTCPEVGRTQNGAYGQLHDDGSFEAVGDDAAGSCVDLRDQPIGFAINHYPPHGKAPARAVLFGAASDKVADLALSLADGTGARDVPIAGGAFMTVLRDDALAGATLDVTLTDGTTTSYPLQPSQAPATAPTDEEGTSTP